MMDEDAQRQGEKTKEETEGKRKEVREREEKDFCMLKEQNLYLSSRTVPTTVHASLTA